MRLKHIEAFNAVMLTGTVSAAARLLHVTQPAVTQTLQHAELQLGFVLFTRQRNRLVPTREAQALYPEVQRLMSQLESVRRIAAALRHGEGSQLRILIDPGNTSNRWGGFFDDDTMAYLFAASQLLVATFLEPFFVAAGFSMYLNRRVELEAWDVEQELRRAFAL